MRLQRVQLAAGVLMCGLIVCGGCKKQQPPQPDYQAQVDQLVQSLTVPPEVLYVDLSRLLAVRRMEQESQTILGRLEPDTFGEMPNAKALHAEQVCNDLAGEMDRNNGLGKYLLEHRDIFDRRIRPLLLLLADAGEEDVRLAACNSLLAAGCEHAKTVDIMGESFTNRMDQRGAFNRALFLIEKFKLKDEILADDTPVFPACAKMTDEMGDDLPPGAAGRLGNSRLRILGDAYFQFSTDDNVLAAWSVDGFWGEKQQTMARVKKRKSRPRYWDMRSGREIERPADFVPQPTSQSAVEPGESGWIIKGERVSDDGRIRAKLNYDRVIEVSGYEQPIRVRTQSDGRSYGGYGLSHDGKTLVWSDQLKVHVIDLPSGRERFDFGGHSFAPVQLVLTKDAILARERQAYVAKWENNKLTKEIGFDNKIGRPLDVSKDGRTVIVGGGPDLPCTIVDLDTGQTKATLGTRSDWPVALSHDGKLVAVGFSGQFGGDESMVGIWDVARQFQRTMTRTDQWVSVLKLLRSDVDWTRGFVVSGSPNGIVRVGMIGVGVHPVDSHMSLALNLVFGHRKAITAVDLAMTDEVWDKEFGPMGVDQRRKPIRVKLMATASHDGRVRAWRVSGYRFRGNGPDPVPADKLLCDVRLRGGAIGTALAISPHGDWVAAGCDDGSIRMIHIATGREAVKLVGHKDRINDLCFESRALYLDNMGREEMLGIGFSNGRLLSASDDMTILKWDFDAVGQWCNTKVSEASTRPAMAPVTREGTH